MSNNWRIIFHSSRVKSPLKIYEWCLRSMNRILMFELKWKINSESWDCLWSSSWSWDHYPQNYKLKLECVPIDGTWSLLRLGLVFVVGTWFRMFDGRVVDKFPRCSFTSSFTSFILMVWLEMEHFCQTNFIDRMEISSFRKSTSKEIISNFVKCAQMSQKKQFLICELLTCASAPW